MKLASVNDSPSLPVAQVSQESAIDKTGEQTKRECALKQVKKKKRITMDLPESAADNLTTYADRTGRSKTEFVRVSVGVFATLCDEMVAGNRVLVTGPDGKTLIKELILPS